MSARQSLRGQTLHLTRRTTQRRFFLAPSFGTLKVCRYAFAHAIEESGQKPHAHVSMSNHNHSQNTDPNGRRSKFTEILHGIIGCFVNGLLQREGHFWDNRRTAESVLLHNPVRGPFDREDDEEGTEDEGLVEAIDSILYQIAVEHDLDIYQIIALYIWMNPVKANLVDQIRQWPGFTVLPNDWGETHTIHRPAEIEAAYPETVTYRAEPPPGRWSEMPLDEAIADANALIELLQDRYRAKRHREGKRVVGPKRLRNQNPWTQPREMRLPVVKRRKTGGVPRFAGHPEDVRVADLAYHVYRRNHAIAARKLHSGDRTVVFPAGAVGMQTIAAVRCRPRPLACEDPMP